MTDLDVTKIIDKAVQIVQDPQIGFAASISYHLQDIEYVSPVNGQLHKYELNLVLGIPEVNRMIPYGKQARQMWRSRKMVRRLRSNWYTPG